MTAQNQEAAQAALKSAQDRSVARMSPVLRSGAALFLAAATVTGAAVAGASQAEARVLPVPVVTAHAGPVTVPSGAVRCKGAGDFHATLAVRTTTKDSKGDHHVAVWLQRHRAGRADLAGYAWSQGAITRVTICLNPARIDGGSGQVSVIVSDVVDAFSRPVVIKFASFKAAK